MAHHSAEGSGQFTITDADQDQVTFAGGPGAQSHWLVGIPGEDGVQHEVYISPDDLRALLEFIRDRISAA